MLSIQDIREAQERVRPYIARTPLLRLPALDEFLRCQVYVKAENMQITGSFKLRGALNRALRLTPEELACGLVCASSGNHGRGIAYAARMLNTHATVVIPNTAPQVKVEAIRALGAEVVQCEASERFDTAARIAREQNATLIPPYDNEDVMAGQGTAGLEIAEQGPELDAVVVPVSGGGLIGGVSAALKASLPDVRVFGAEPEALPRYSASLAAGEPVQVPFRRTLADALVSQMPGRKCFPVVQRYVDQVVPVADSAMLRAMKLLLLQGKLLAEPSSCIGMGAVLQETLRFRETERVCFLVSGGSVGLSQLAALDAAE